MPVDRDDPQKGCDLLVKVADDLLRAQEPWGKNGRQ
jgi:hypothetical protein